MLWRRLKDRGRPNTEKGQGTVDQRENQLHNSSTVIYCPFPNTADLDGLQLPQYPNANRHDDDHERREGDNQCIRIKSWSICYFQSFLSKADRNLPQVAAITTITPSTTTTITLSTYVRGLLVEGACSTSNAPSSMASSPLAAPSSLAASLSSPPAIASASISTEASPTSSAYPTPIECGNFGIEFALYPNESRSIVIDPTVYASKTPITSGITPYLGFA